MSYVRESSRPCGRCGGLDLIISPAPRLTLFRRRYIISPTYFECSGCGRRRDLGEKDRPADGEHP